MVARLPEASPRERSALLDHEAEALVVEARRLSLRLEQVLEAVQDHWNGLSEVDPGVLPTAATEFCPGRPGRQSRAGGAGRPVRPGRYARSPGPRLPPGPAAASASSRSRDSRPRPARPPRATPRRRNPPAADPRVAATRGRQENSPTTAPRSIENLMGAFPCDERHTLAVLVGGRREEQRKLRRGLAKSGCSMASTGGSPNEPVVAQPSSGGSGDDLRLIRIQSRGRPRLKLRPPFGRWTSFGTGTA